MGSAFRKETKASSAGAEGKGTRPPLGFVVLPGRMKDWSGGGGDEGGGGPPTGPPSTEMRALWATAFLRHQRVGGNVRGTGWGRGPSGAEGDAAPSILRNQRVGGCSWEPRPFPGTIPQLTRPVLAGRLQRTTPAKPPGVRGRGQAWQAHPGLDLNPSFPRCLGP